MILQIDTPGWITARSPNLDFRRNLILGQPTPERGGILLCRGTAAGAEPKVLRIVCGLGRPGSQDSNNAKMVFVDLFRQGLIWKLQSRTDGYSHATEWNYGYGSRNMENNFGRLPRLWEGHRQIQEWIGFGDASDAPPEVFYCATGTARILSRRWNRAGSNYDLRHRYHCREFSTSLCG